MGRGYFRSFTAAEKTELWDRWHRGESLKAIGRAFGKPSSSIYFQLAPHGGIRPAPRRRSRLALPLAEREEISRALTEYQSIRSIARVLGRSPSTVSREIRRNGGYRAALADEEALVRTRRLKRCKLANNTRLRQLVAKKLRLNWAPEQIAGWLKKTYPEDESCQVSHDLPQSIRSSPWGAKEKSYCAICDRSGRSVDRGKPACTRIDAGKSWIPSRSGSGRQWSKIARFPVIGRRSPVRVEEQLYHNPGRTSYALRDVS